MGAILLIVIIVGVIVYATCSTESSVMRDVDRMIKRNVEESDRYFKEKYGDDFGKRKK